MNTPYFDQLIDDFGIWQHTKNQQILRQHGYALDDAARGLITCLVLDKMNQASVLFEYLEKSYDGTRLYGFAHADRTFFSSPASEDATAQAVWALGYAWHLGFQKARATTLLQALRPKILNAQYVRGPAYALLGALYIDRELADQLMAKLRSFFVGTTSGWPWPEPTMTYGNGILPYAFLRYGLVTGDKSAIRDGRKLLAFIQQKCETNRPLGPVGNEGWLPKGSNEPPDFAQQPIDAAYMIWACVAAYELSGNQSDLVLAKRWWQWYEGHNIAKTRMYNPQTLEAYDGIERAKINDDSGAESNICLLLSMKMLETKKTV